MHPGARILLFLALPLFAQQPALQERLEVRLIEVDAVVTDKHGNPVTGLGPDDFELFENRKRQTISNFSEYRETEVTTSEPRSATAPARPEPRTIVFLIDTLQLRGNPRKSLFDSLRSLTARVMREGDRAHVLQWHDMAGVRTLAPQTTERTDIERALTAAEATVEGRVPDGPSIEEQAAWFRSTAETPEAAAAAEANIETSVRQGAEQDYALMRRKTASIQRILASLTDPNRRTAFIYVSDNFPLIAGQRFFIGQRPAEGFLSGQQPAYSTQPMLEAIVRAANAQGIVFYALRPEVPNTVGQIRSLLEEQAVFDQIAPGSDAERDFIHLQNEISALSIVADATGGSVAVGEPGVQRAVDSIARDLGSYYTLAYRATTDGSDRQRRVEVRAKNRDHVVRARTTLVDRSDKTRARDLLIARLFENGPSAEIDFDVTLEKPKPARRGRVLIPVNLSIPADQLRFEEEGQENATRFSVLAVAGANIGQITKVTEETRRVGVPRGTQPEGFVSYRFEILADSKPTRVSIAVFDEKSGLTGTQIILISKGQARVQASPGDPQEDAVWQEALERANREKKVIVAFFRPKRCRECIEFERESVPHPTIQRRLSSVVFAQLIIAGGEASKQWDAKEPGFALFDRNGVLRARWRTGVPDTTTFGAVLDGVIAVAPHFELAVRRTEEAGPDDGEVEAAIGLARLRRTADARAALERAIANGSPETRQYAVITSALMDANEGNAKKAIEDLDRLISNAVTPEISAEAWVAAGMVHRGAGDRALAMRAFSNGSALAADGSPVRVAAQQALQQLQAAPAAARGPIEIIPIRRPVVSGRVTVMTRTTSVAVARVKFLLDGQPAGEVARPPFSVTVNFGQVPQRRTIRAIALDARGREVGADEQVVNDAGETFSLRMTEPVEGQVSGPVRVALSLRAPALSAVRRVVITWNDAERAVLSAPPWQARIHVPAGQLGVLRAVAELDNGRTAEDAVLLNASGAVEHADVHLLEIPVTITSREQPAPAVEPRDIVVTDSGRRRAVQSIAGSADTPLTIGLLLDSSASMQKPLPDVQEAALRFLETMLTDRDRAFLVTFDSDARILQAPTSDRALLRRQIMGIIPDGLTALHDAIALGLLQFEGVKGRRALVVFTDGIDRTSRYGPDDVADLARRMNVPIHIIAARTSALPVAAGSGSIPRGAMGVLTNQAQAEVARAYRALERLTAATGGSTQMLHRLEQLPALYEHIEAALRAQMLVFVRTDPGTRDNEWRELRVDVTRGRFDVRAPEGYYAPW